MTATITHPFRFQHLREVMRRLQAGKDLYYLGVGRSEAWPNDLTPPQPSVDPETEVGARLGLQAVKKIVDFQFGAPRRNWVTGSTYVAYDSKDADLHTKAFYALNTSTFRVYLCLRAGAGVSTVEPTGIDDDEDFGGTEGDAGSSIPQAGADGYVWKYLYTIDGPAADRFLTVDYMPVLRDEEVAANAVYGQIWSIDILTAGSGYGSAPTVTISGDGTGATATASVSGGAVTGTTVTNPGSGYTYAVATVSGGSPAVAATLRPNPSTLAVGRELLGVDVDNGGTGYSNVSTPILIEGDGYDAEITATVSGGVIQDNPTIDAGGYGYSMAILTPDNEAGDGAVLIPEFSGLKGGFGYDTRTDLRAFYLIMRVLLEGAEGGDFIPANDYRQLMILKNPLSTGSPPIPFTATTGNALKYLTVSPGGTWVLDDLITGGTSGAKAYVDYYDADNSRLYYHQTPATRWVPFTSAETLTGVGASTGAIATDGQSGAAEVDRFSGVMLYLENRAPVSRSSDQTEDIRLVVQF